MWKPLLDWFRRRLHVATGLVDDHFFARERDIRVGERRLEIFTRQADMLKESIEYAKHH